MTPEEIYHDTIEAFCALTEEGFSADIAAKLMNIVVKREQAEELRRRNDIMEILLKGKGVLETR